jgi:predicted Zn-dependent peptidase
VQADKTGVSVQAMIADMAAFPAKSPVTPTELGRVTDGNIRGLPNRYETNAAVLGALLSSEVLGRPDDYYNTLPARYRAVDAAQIDEAAKRWLQPQGMTFVIVGDRKVIEPQFKDIGLPVEYIETVAAR